MARDLRAARRVFLGEGDGSFRRVTATAERELAFNAGQARITLENRTSPSTAERATAERATAERATAERATAERATAERATAEQGSAEL